jgi:hypothetical protein
MQEHNGKEEAAFKADWPLYVWVYMTHCSCIDTQPCDSISDFQGFHWETVGLQQYEDSYFLFFCLCLYWTPSG